MGDRSGGLGGSAAPHPLPVPQPGPEHSRHFAPNFTLVGNIQLLFSLPFSCFSTELGSTAACDTTAARRDSALIYLSTASLSARPFHLLPMWMMESARTETH